MKDYAAFKSFYSRQLLDELLALDAYRKKMLTKSSIVIMILLAAAVAISLLVRLDSVHRLILIAVTWTGCAAAGWTAVRFITRNYRDNFKQLVIRPLIRFIDPNLTYSPEGSIDLYTFRRAEIFQRYTNEFDGEDLVTGTLGKTSIKFSEVNARYRDEETDDPRGGHPMVILVRWIIVKLLCNRNVFTGLFFTADFNKTFYGQVLVVPDKAERYFGRFGQMLQEQNVFRGDLMKMDNAAFERDFAVYGTDPIQTRYVLSPAIMDRILDFRKQTGSTVWLSFKDSMLYLAVPCKRNLFEPKYFKSLVDYVATFDYFHDLNLFAGIVEAFNLNTRIWTKE